MKTLRFNIKFKNMIENGLKTCTTRTHYNLNMNECFRALYVDGDGGCELGGIYKVKEIHQILFESIPYGIVRREGYMDEDLFKDELKRIYPHLADKSVLYSIIFEIESE